MLQPKKIQDYLASISRPYLPVEDFLKRTIFKNGLWLLGIPALIYGVADRGMAIFAKAAIEITDISYCAIAAVILFGWLFIGMSEDYPKVKSLDPKMKPLDEHKSANAINLQPNSTCIAQQIYRLPFPYICQIYHLLNLKHLEEIHRFSLGNLKIVEVSHFRKTQTGGQIRFKTVLDSPFNILRIWRQQSVDVDLILHAPHQIELSVPVYQQKFIRVLFNVIPLNTEEHYLFIQMFSNLQWPRELLRSILLLAASVTLLEDLPYLAQLARRNIALSESDSDDKALPQAMRLFQQYIELYGKRLEQKQLSAPDGDPMLGSYTIV